MKLLNILILSLFISSCFAKRFDGVKVESLEFIKRHGVKQVIGSDFKIPLIEYWNDSDFIILKTDIPKTIIEYIKKKGATFNVNAKFCNSEEFIVLLGLPEIYKNKIGSNNVEFEEEFYSHNVGDVYNLVIFTSWQKDRKLQESFRKKKSQEYYLKYDLRREPKDICITLSGTNMMSNYETNEVIITKKQIEEVLKNN